MAADGSDARRVTNAKGYDGGPFFSPDGKRICFRGFRNPKSARLANLYVIDADGKNETQLTFDDAVSWAPYWHPNGDVLVYSKNVEGRPELRALPDPALGQGDDPHHAEPRAGRAAGLLARRQEADVDVDARGRPVADLRRRLPPSDRGGVEARGPRRRRSASPRRPRRGARPAARGPIPVPDAKSALRRRQRSSRTTRCRAAGRAPTAPRTPPTSSRRRSRRRTLAPAGENGTYRQTFDVLVGVEAGLAERAHRSADGARHARPTSCRMAFSTRPRRHGRAPRGRSSFRGYGVAAPGVYDDYAGLPDVKGKIVLLFLRGIPDGLPKRQPARRSARRSRELRQSEGGEAQGRGGRRFRRGFAASARRAAPRRSVPKGPNADVGMPVARISRAALGEVLARHGRTLEGLEAAPKDGAPTSGFDLDVTASMTASINVIRGKTDNVIGLVRGREKPDEIVILCAHYDHLGFGGPNSLAQGAAPEIHNGADDNASGTAGILEIARRLAASPPKRSVLVAAWTGEEDGLLGSAQWAEHPTGRT